MQYVYDFSSVYIIESKIGIIKAVKTKAKNKTTSKQLYRNKVEFMIEEDPSTKNYNLQVLTILVRKTEPIAGIGAYE